MLLVVVLPVVVLAIIVALLWRWYRRTIADLAPDAGTRELSGVRLTSERLRSLPQPPWRVVFEIGPAALGPIDHVVIGPGGVIAIQTLIGDRPEPDESSADSARVPLEALAAAAVARNDVDELTAAVGAPCRLLARVYWGAPRPDAPAAFDIAPGLIAVEGQRLEEWLLQGSPGSLTSAQVDLAWQRLVTGIGRPDPLP